MFDWIFRVEYVDTDAMGVAHHSSYFRWLERARVEWLRSLEMPYRDLERQGYGLPLRSARIDYKSPLRFDDEVHAQVWVEELGRAGIVLGYRLKSAGNEIAHAQTDHVLCRRGEKNGAITWSPTRIPEEWRKVWLPQSVVKSSTSP